MLDKEYTREKRERNERRGERREGKEKCFIKNFVLGAGEVAL